MPNRALLAERCFRVVGSKKHVSGCSRTIEGTRSFAAIWSYLSTARKMGHSYWEAAYEVSCGHAMELIFPDGVEAAIAERKRESEGLPLSPTNTNAENSKDAA